MTDLHENLGWIIGSIATAVAMAVGWFISSGAVTNLLFLLLGAGITYFVQTKTQKRAWKREYSVRIAEEVYGSLFSNIKGIILSLERKWYRHLGFDTWRLMQDDHRYFMVDEKFRAKLDNFDERIEKYDLSVNEVTREILPEIIKEAIKETFNVEALKQVSLEVKYKQKNRNFSTSPNLIQCLISATHPKDHVLKSKANVSNAQLDFKIPKRNGEVFHSTNLDKFNEFWSLCETKLNENETCKFVIEEDEKLLTEARNIKKEIVKRIEEPWKI